MSNNKRPIYTLDGKIYRSLETYEAALRQKDNRKKKDLTKKVVNKQKHIEKIVREAKQSEQDTKRRETRLSEKEMIERRVEKENFAKAEREKMRLDRALLVVEKEREKEELKIRHIEKDRESLQDLYIQVDELNTELAQQVAMFSKPQQKFYSIPTDVETAIDGALPSVNLDIEEPTIKKVYHLAQKYTNRVFFKTPLNYPIADAEFKQKCFDDLVAQYEYMGRDYPQDAISRWKQCKQGIPSAEEKAKIIEGYTENCLRTAREKYEEENDEILEHNLFQIQLIGKELDKIISDTLQLSDNFVQQYATDLIMFEEEMKQQQINKQIIEESGEQVISEIKDIYSSLAKDAAVIQKSINGMIGAWFADIGVEDDIWAHSSLKNNTLTLNITVPNINKYVPDLGTYRVDTNAHHIYLDTTVIPTGYSNVVADFYRLLPISLARSIYNLDIYNKINTIDLRIWSEGINVDGSLRGSTLENRLLIDYPLIRNYNGQDDAFLKASISTDINVEYPDFELVSHDYQGILYLILKENDK